MPDPWNRRTYDALIVDARCAGATTAALLARAGARVLLIDQSPEIGNTLSTHALMRPAVAVLDRLSLIERIMSAETPVVSRTRFYYGPSDVLDLPIKPMGSAGGLLAPRRYVLDRILADAAIEAGADLRTGVALETLTRNASGRITGAELRLPDGRCQSVRAGLVVGADGRPSRVAEQVHAPALGQDPHRAAMTFGYFDGIPNEGYRWYFGNRSQAALIPTTNGQHCVAAACRPADYRERFGDDAHAGLVRALSEWEPALAEGIASEGSTVRLRRFLGGPGLIRECVGAGWALVGDAGYYKDPVTAHGITDALLDSCRLAGAFAASPGDLRTYQDHRNDHAHDLFRITQRIASFDWTLEEVMELHEDLNAQMKRELSDLTLDPGVAASAGQAGRSSVQAAPDPGQAIPHIRRLQG